MILKRNKKRKLKVEYLKNIISIIEEYLVILKAYEEYDIQKKIKKDTAGIEIDDLIDFKDPNTMKNKDLLQEIVNRRSIEEIMQYHYNNSLYTKLDNNLYVVKDFIDILSLLFRVIGKIIRMIK